MKRLILLGVAVCMSWVLTLGAMARECRGQVVDEAGEPLIGAIVTVPGTKVGASTDADGKFNLNVPENAKKIKVSFVGYKPMELAVASNLGVIKMSTDVTTLQDVVVTQSVARTRKTPVALSQIDGGHIETKLGAQEFPEILKTTPGVWATPDGGGYGDSKINMRGFKSENVAVLINGIPINDMEWGGVYWSNWSGLSDVTSNMQSQRGLGAAILSAPSVGGTINITTRSLDAKKGGSAWYGMGNDGMNQYGLMLSTGLMSNGWAVTILGSRRYGDGWVQGTNYSAYNYFANISKKINDNHQLSLTAFGAPQTHYKRSSQDGLSIEGWQSVADYMNGESPYRYNPTFGYGLHGEMKSSSYNFYHKPQISLNHIWQIDYKSSLSTTAYGSIASGGGYSGQGHGTYNGQTISNSSWYGVSNGVLNTIFRCADGTFDYAAIQRMNMESTTGSNMVMSSSNNDHVWYGLVSTYKNELMPKKLIFTGGIDLRYYIGKHNNKIVDLYDGEYYMNYESRKSVKPENNAIAADPFWKFEKLGVGDIVYRNYNGYTVQEGGYGQLEYTALDDKLTTILAGSISNTSYWRKDFFYYDAEHSKSETRHFLGGTIKGGANYNIDRNNNVFVNGGFISRAPFFSNGVFLSSSTSNIINPNPKNSKIASIEAGYGYRSKEIVVNANVYWTKWYDKCDNTTTRTGDITAGELAGEKFVFNMAGVNARHAGVELNGSYKPADWFQLDGMISVGDWVWDSNPTGYFYSSTGQPLKNLRGDIASGIMAEDHASATLNQKGRKIGGSAQTTGFVGLTFRPNKSFRFGIDWVASARNYSDYTISSTSYEPGKEVIVADPWRIPWGNEVDLNASYKFKIGNTNATIYGNVNNLFNHYYVKDAYTPSDVTGEWNNAFRVFYALGRSFSLKLKINF